VGPTGPRVVVEPGYRRTHLLGGSFANAHGHLMKEDDPLVCTALATEALTSAL